MITIYKEFQQTVRGKGMKLRPIAYGYGQLGRCELFAREEKTTDGDTATSYVIGTTVRHFLREVSWEYAEYFNIDQNGEEYKKAINCLRALCLRGLQ